MLAQVQNNKTPTADLPLPEPRPPHAPPSKPLIGSNHQIRASHLKPAIAGLGKSHPHCWRQPQSSPIPLRCGHDRTQPSLRNAPPSAARDPSRDFASHPALVSTLLRQSGLRRPSAAANRR
ncbi:mucin-5AC-like isoform X4 [Iris pallida]|uniref:Mucin-5AC-like isoform X4 n=1 Tax=Iris pallida TaxID=29817 RepID=A0AAX6FVB2_IRIPA|nr:mucin-5AC-like isoform X4 [Iris pallida]